MKKYNVEIKETLSRIVPINAENEKEAKKIAMKMYYNEKIQFSYEDFDNVECEIVKK